jgi:hypothetical protein
MNWPEAIGRRRHRAQIQGHSGLAYNLRKAELLKNKAKTNNENDDLPWHLFYKVFVKRIIKILCSFSRDLMVVYQPYYKYDLKIIDFKSKTAGF